MGAFFLLYDSDCCFCTDFAAWVARRSRAVETVPLKDPRAVEWVPDKARRESSFHLVGAGGVVQSGPEALPAIAELTLGRAAGMALAGCPDWALRRIYRWVSETRWQPRQKH